MITRNLAGLYPVTGIVPMTFHSCTVAGFTCACGPSAYAFTGGWPGPMINRASLPESYQAVKVAVHGLGSIQASATSCRIQYIGVSIGLQHACSTGAGWTDYSTGDFVTDQAGYYVSTATSTADAWWNETRRIAYGALTTAQTTSTSTGLAEVRASATFDLTGAKQYIRVVVAPRIETTGCGGSYVPLAGELIFGHPDVEPFSFADQSRVIVTSGCSTTT